MRPRCVRCPEIATYDSPASYCDRHWAEWWVDGMAPNVSGEERERLVKETLHNTRRGRRSLEMLGTLSSFEKKRRHT